MIIMVDSNMKRCLGVLHDLIQDKFILINLLFDLDRGLFFFGQEYKAVLLLFLLLILSLR